MILATLILILNLNNNGNILIINNPNEFLLLLNQHWQLLFY